MLVQSASVAVCTEVEALMFDVRAPVDIKELKLLGDFDHPNIVRFVRVRDLSLSRLQLMICCSSA